MGSKVTSMERAVGAVADGMIVALGGNVLHRSPSAAVREIVRQGRRDLKVIKTAGGYDVDLLAQAGAICAVWAGYVGYENEFGLATHYRRAVERGEVEAREHTCYSVITALRAASYGVPYLPMNGLWGSDLLERRPEDFRVVDDPFGQGPVVAVRAIRPDVAIVHVQKADTEGNCAITGTLFEDVLMVSAARLSIVTAEEVVLAGSLDPESVSIPAVLVSHVVHAPGGARPASCHGYYGIDAEAVRALAAAQTAVGR